MTKLVTCDLCKQPREAGFPHTNAQCINAVLARVRKLEAEREGAAVVKLETMRVALRDHWLAGITCDHEAGTDTAACACGALAPVPQPSVGAAVGVWIEHVIAAIRAAGGER